MLDAGVGLWDTVAAATREGSLDAAIRLHEASDLAALAATLPDLRAIGFNGATSARIGRRQLGRGARPRADRPALLQPGLCEPDVREEARGLAGARRLSLTAEAEHVAAYSGRAMTRSGMQVSAWL